MKSKQNLRWTVVLFTAGFGQLLYVCTAPAQISIATVPISNAGNLGDTVVESDGTTGYGAVNYNYNIGKYDVTAGQYTAFLNAVATTGDPYALYNPSMANGVAACGISQFGSAGNYSYVTTKNPNYPVNWVTFWDAARFANWLDNQQPNGPEGQGTTETGAYTLTAAGINNDTVTRNANWSWAVTSENEWYKAAYYNPTASSYSYYATQSGVDPSNQLSSTGTNNANYLISDYTDPTNYLTPVGAFASSPSAYGTYDQNGDVNQWNDTNVSGPGLRGGSFGQYANAMQSVYRLHGYDGDYDYTGFRVVSSVSAAVPEPASASIFTLAAICLFARRRADVHVGQLRRR